MAQARVSRRKDFVRNTTSVGNVENCNELAHFTRFAVLCSTVRAVVSWPFTVRPLDCRRDIWKRRWLRTGESVGIIWQSGGREADWPRRRSHLTSAQNPGSTERFNGMECIYEPQDIIWTSLRNRLEIHVRGVHSKHQIHVGPPVPLAAYSDGSDLNSVRRFVQHDVETVISCKLQNLFKLTFFMQRLLAKHRSDKRDPILSDH
jgi:hypothetical protein